MGFISVIQGAATQNRYRALVVVRGRAACATLPLEAGRVERCLRDLGRVAYRLETDRLRSARNHRFDLADDGGNATYLDTYMFADFLPPEGVIIAVGTCFFEGFNEAPRIGTMLRQPWLTA